MFPPVESAAKGGASRRPRLGWWSALSLRAKGLVVVAIPVLCLILISLIFYAVHDDRWTRGIALLGLFLGLAGGLAAAYLFTSSIVNRLELIIRKASAVPRGEPVRIELAPGDEISDLERELATASALMMQREALLIQREVQLREFNQRLEERVRERTEALRESEERFRLFMDHLPAAAFVKDAQGHYLFGNRAWRQRFPASAGEPEGKTDADLWPPEIAATFRASDQKVLSSGQPLQLIETGKVGSEQRYWLVNKFCIDDAEGVPLIGGVSLDITESKRLEEQLSQAQKMEAIGLLAGGVAHDFNNLLTVILGYAEVAGSRLEEGSPAYHDVKAIAKAAEQAAALTAQLLAFGRRQILQPRILSLNHLLTDIAKLLKRVVRENIEVVLDLAEDLGAVKADPVQMQQVVMNLAINARDAMPEGGRLIIQTRNMDLDRENTSLPQAVSPGSYVVLVVTDTGVGMDAATRERIFEPFFTTKEKHQGTGLGLSTVFGIVKQSGGYIWVDSEPGRGSSFQIWLPRVEMQDAPQPTAAASPRSSRPVQQEATILVVEDDPMVRKLIVNVCSGAGFTVLEAANGMEALALCENHAGPIHVMVTDVVMPGISGRTLAERLVPLRPDIKVLYCSGYTETAVFKDGVLEPDMFFLQKPFTPEALLDRIRRLIPAQPALDG